MVLAIIQTICLSHLVHEIALRFVLQLAASFVLRCTILLGVSTPIISLVAWV